jgi:type II secretory pathway pseudopilin PulG
MIAVVIVGILAVLALPAFKRATLAAQNNRLENDLRIFSASFHSYNMSEGGWPAAAAESIVPMGMPFDFRATAWEGNTPVGGRWQWVNDGTVAGIQLVGVGVPAAQMQLLDRAFDDGDLSTGQFRSVGGGDYLLELR